MLSFPFLDFFPNLLPKWRALPLQCLSLDSFPLWLSPLQSSKCGGLLQVHALIFQLPWVNRDELAPESKLSTLWMGSSAKFPQLRHKHQSCRLQKRQVLGGGINNLFMQRVISAEASSLQSDPVFWKDTFPGLSEWRCHLFSLRAAAHQISISSLEMYLGRRQVVFRGLMTADLWILSGISAIGVTVMAGAAASPPRRSSWSNHSKPVKWFWFMTFTFRGPLDLLSRCVNSKTAIPMHPPPQRVHWSQHYACTENGGILPSLISLIKFAQYILQLKFHIDSFLWLTFGLDETSSDLASL